MHPSLCCSLLAALVAAASVATPARAQDGPDADGPTGIDHGIDRPWTGDLDGMVERRLIRMLVVPSRTFYFVDKGRQRGLSYDQGRAFDEKGVTRNWWTPETDAKFRAATDKLAAQYDKYCPVEDGCINGRFTMGAVNDSVPRWLDSAPCRTPPMPEASVAICSCRRRMPCSSASGRGGQPGTYTSTGMSWSTPFVTL